MSLAIRYRFSHDYPTLDRAIRARVVAAFDRFEPQIQTLEAHIANDGPVVRARISMQSQTAGRITAFAEADDPVSAVHLAAQRARAVLCRKRGKKISSRRAA